MSTMETKKTKKDTTTVAPDVGSRHKNLKKKKKPDLYRCAASSTTGVGSSSSSTQSSSWIPPTSLEAIEKRVKMLLDEGIPSMEETNALSTDNIMAINIWAKKVHQVQRAFNRLVKFITPILYKWESNHTGNSRQNIENLLDEMSNIESLLSQATVFCLSVRYPTRNLICVREEEEEEAMTTEPTSPLTPSLSSSSLERRHELDHRDAGAAESDLQKQRELDNKNNSGEDTKSVTTVTTTTTGSQGSSGSDVDGGGGGATTTSSSSSSTTGSGSTTTVDDDDHGQEDEDDDLLLPPPPKKRKTLKYRIMENAIAHPDDLKLYRELLCDEALDNRELIIVALTTALKVFKDYKKASANETDSRNSGMMM